MKVSDVIEQANISIADLISTSITFGSDPQIYNTVNMANMVQSRVGSLEVVIDHKVHDYCKISERSHIW